MFRHFRSTVCSYRLQASITFISLYQRNSPSPWNYLLFFFFFFFFHLTISYQWRQFNCQFILPHLLSRLLVSKRSIWSIDQRFGTIRSEMFFLGEIFEIIVAVPLRQKFTNKSSERFQRHYCFLLTWHYCFYPMYPSTDTDTDIQQTLTLSFETSRMHRCINVQSHIILRFI